MNKKIFFGILVSLLLVYLSVRGIHFQDVVHDLQKIQRSYVIVFLLLIILMQYLRSYRWGVILQPMQKIDQLSLFSVTSVGFLAIAAIPARIGELARPYLIARKSSVKMSSALGTIIVERILDSFTILSIAVVVLFFTDLPSWMISSSVIFFLLALAIFCFVLFMILQREKALRVINIILKKFPGKLADKIDELLHNFINGLQIVTNINLFLYLIFLSVAIWLLDVLAIYTLLMSFGFTLPIMASFVLMIILIVGIAIPTAPGFIGNWHFACVLGLSLFGLAKSEALSFAVVYHFLSMVVVVVLGVLFMPFNKFSISDMKNQINSEK
ncbi:MAG TPA: lysylphosphatidylglycerol synthase transmembrane domain-containing protein [Smithella sp.]|nr:lysylphosphatidylglycerol synthase transmembrane domain-containing protein [Smithella sp.]